RMRKRRSRRRGHVCAGCRSASIRSTDATPARGHNSIHRSVAYEKNDPLLMLMVRVSSGFSGYDRRNFGLSLSLYLTIMVHLPQSNTIHGANSTAESNALALRNQTMATTLVSVDTREVLRCDHCKLVQYRTSNSLCRKCHKPLDIEEP